MSGEPVDAFAAAQAEGRRNAVRLGAKAEYDKRLKTLGRDYADPDSLRRLAGDIKQHTLDHLDVYLERAVAQLESHGAKVHFAADGEAACQAVLEILAARGAKRVVKTKSMATEEVELGAFLERHGVESVETDLGEFVVQLDKDRPSHIVKPIMHRDRREVARTFEGHGLGAYDDTPEVITRRARQHLRRKYLEADVGISGANFVSAESGRLVLVTNEGNSRFCLAATRCHIAVVGIEKLVPRDRDLAVFLNLLARSATGQTLSVYTEFIAGPRAAGQPDGPEEMHVIFLDNGRSEILAGDCREILRCIRCGACLNVCPVYRQASGHAYRGVYSGPVGAVLTPLLAGEHFADYADLPRASSLCGACNEVCPVDIPLPDLLLRLRDRGKRAGVRPAGAAPSMASFARLASRPASWRRALAAGKLLRLVPSFLRPRALRVWEQNHALPSWRGGAFRAWMKTRARPETKTAPP
ncbi:MAG TPA: LutB/LldF family L-lactate oxidation iron-sulfur protein [Polyangia bacterium]|nr:LutB/LldF family L-lactate oxidation iron-sulfur protein [Polyangia bacterium]